MLRSGRQGRHWQPWPSWGGNSIYIVFILWSRAITKAFFEPQETLPQFSYQMHLNDKRMPGHYTLYHINTVINTAVLWGHLLSPEQVNGKDPWTVSVDRFHMFDHVDKEDKGKQMSMVDENRRAVNRRNERGLLVPGKLQ